MNGLDTGKTYLITGGAGFIGYHLSKRLLEKGAVVIGFDNLNDYYDVSLKKDRLADLKKFERYTFIKGDLAEKSDVFRIFQEYRPQIAVNLGAQAGVRYSIDNPDAYMQSNMMGFFHILEGCRYFPVEHLVYASSSSVYGGNEKVPFSTQVKVISDSGDRTTLFYGLRAFWKTGYGVFQVYEENYGRRADSNL